MPATVFDEAELRSLIADWRAAPVGEVEAYVKSMIRAYLDATFKNWSSPIGLFHSIFNTAMGKAIAALAGKGMTDVATSKAGSTSVCTYVTSVQDNRWISSATNEFIKLLVMVGFSPDTIGQARLVIIPFARDYCLFKYGSERLNIYNTICRRESDGPLPDWGTKYSTRVSCTTLPALQAKGVETAFTGRALDSAGDYCYRLDWRQNPPTSSVNGIVAAPDKYPKLSVIARPILKSIFEFLVQITPAQIYEMMYPAMPIPSAADYTTQLDKMVSDLYISA